MKKSQSQNVLVIGASRGTGLAVVKTLLAVGCRVTAFSRSASSIQLESEHLTTVDGDATNPADVDAAVAGHDAVIVTLGIAENPLSVRMLGARNTADDVRSRGTRNVIEAMKRHDIQRLVVQTSYGVGDTRDELGFMDRMFFSLFLKPQIADTEIQEHIVRTSGLDWVVAQPVHLTDDATDASAFVSARGETGKMKVSRLQVAAVLVDAVSNGAVVRQSLSISSRAA